MSFLLAQSATDHVDMINQLEDFATGNSLDSLTPPTISAAGTGYVVGDIVTLSGGTSSIAAQLEVLTVGGSGDVTSLKIAQSGVYTVNPGNPVSTTGGTGTGLTVNCTFVSNAWTTHRRSQEAASAAINAGGTGYTVNDTITVTSGLAAGLEGNAVTLNVDSVSGGVITAVSITDEGIYHEPPGSLTGMAVTGGTGSGATVDLTLQRSVTNLDREHQWIAEGNGSGSDNIYVGIRCYSTGSFHHWELAGMNGYTAANPWETQPNISPGRYDSSEEGQYVPMDNTSLNYWVFLNGRRMIGVFDVGGLSLTNMYLGYYNPFGTSVEFPYPLFVGGCSSSHSQAFNSGQPGYSGMLDPISADGHDDGPARLLGPDGVWRTVRNSYQSGSTRVRSEDLVVFPAGNPDTASLGLDDKWSSGDVTTIDMIPATGNPGTAVSTMEQTPDSGGHLVNMMPTLILQASPTRLIHGEMDAVYWCPNNANLDVATILAQDKIDVSGQIYHVFHNCRRTEQFTYFAVKEE